MERDERIRKQNAESAKKHEALLQKAQDWKETVTSERQDLIASRKKENKEKQETLLNDDESSESPWENVLKYCDLKVDTESDEKEKDTNRMGQLYRRLKSEKHK